jgi:hypothetical protein
VSAGEENMREEARPPAAGTRAGQFSWPDIGFFASPTNHRPPPELTPVKGP